MWRNLVFFQKSEFLVKCQACWTFILESRLKSSARFPWFHFRLFTLSIFHRQTQFCQLRLFSSSIRLQDTILVTLPTLLKNQDFFLHLNDVLCFDPLHLSYSLNLIWKASSVLKFKCCARLSAWWHSLQQSTNWLERSMLPLAFLHFFGPSKKPKFLVIVFWRAGIWPTFFD